jgi:uncharacterized protein (DUF1697 family)
MSDIKVLLLRGVNVGGANRLPMPEFRQMLVELGLSHVQTHIQSGNVVFVDPGIKDLAAVIAAGMRDRFGFAPKMFLMSLAAFEAVLAANPYADAARANGALVHIFFLDAPFAAEDVKSLTALAARDEEITFGKQAVYLNAPSGIGRSHLAEKLSATQKLAVTARNTNSAVAIAALAHTIPK